MITYKLTPSSLIIERWTIDGLWLKYKLSSRILCYDSIRFSPKYIHNPFLDPKVISYLLYKANNKLLKEYLDDTDEHLLKSGMCPIYTTLSYC